MSPTPPNGQPSPQQLAAMQQIAIEAKKRGMTPQQFHISQRQQMEAEARKAGMSVEQYIAHLKQQALQNHQRQQQQLAQQQAAEKSGQPQVQQGDGGEQVPITPGAPDPKALALAKWLRSQDLKARTCILNGQRKDMFRGIHPVALFSSFFPLKYHVDQSNVPSAPSNPPPTQPHAQRTPSFPPSAPATPTPRSSSSYRYPSWRYAYPKPTRMRVTTTLRRRRQKTRNGSRAFGTSRSSNNRT